MQRVLFKCYKTLHLFCLFPGKRRDLRDTLKVFKNNNENYHSICFPGIFDKNKHLKRSFFSLFQGKA